MSPCSLIASVLLVMACVAIFFECDTGAECMAFVASVVMLVGNWV